MGCLQSQAQANSPTEVYPEPRLSWESTPVWSHNNRKFNRRRWTRKNRAVAISTPWAMRLSLSLPDSLWLEQRKRQGDGDEYKL